MNTNNTFIFNLEWYAVLQEYPAEVRLEVYEAIMRYASSGTLPELKPLAKMAFSFIKKEMDYNRDRYQATVEKRREAGRSGALARQGRQDKQSQANEANATDAKQSLAKQANATDAKPAKQSLAKQADYDNVNDNVLSSTTARVRAREPAEEPPEKILDDLFRDKAAVEAFCITNRISPEQLRRIAGEVVTEWQLTGQTHASATEARRHLLNQTRIKIHANDTQPQDKYARRRSVDTAARSPEDYTGKI